MSNKTRDKRIEFLDWFKEGGLLVVTLTGLLLYFFLSLPATVFYARLGTTPGEVGITYGGLLGGSTVEIAVLIVVLTSAFLMAASVIAFVGVSARFAAVTSSYRKTPEYRKSLRELSDTEFEARAKFYRDVYGRVPELADLAASVLPQGSWSFEQMENRERRRRELERIPVRTAEQSAELEFIESQRTTVDPVRMSLFLTRHWIRRKGRALATCFIAFTVIALLPALAFVQANEVRSGRTFIGESSGIFDYRADLVTVTPTSRYSTSSVRALGAQSLFLLGQNNQDVILYSPSMHSTIRIPPIAVIIATVG